jgi:hypothetical protein
MITPDNNGISFSYFLKVWMAISVITWLLVCGFTIIFYGQTLDSGLVPKSVILSLSLIPTMSITLFVQIFILLISGRITGNYPKKINKRLILGTVFISWIAIIVIVWLSGGVASFVPRL